MEGQLEDWLHRMMERTRKILLVILEAELAEQSADLIRIATDAGDTHEQAIEWAVNDTQLAKLSDIITHFRLNCPRRTISEAGFNAARRRWREQQCKNMRKWQELDRLVEKAKNKMLQRGKK